MHSPEPETTINERLKILIGALGLTTRAFSENINESPGNTQNYIGSRQLEPKHSYLAKVVKHYSNVNAHWLLTGEGTPLLEVTQDSSSAAKIRNISGGTNTVGNHNNPTTINIAKVTDLDHCKSKLETALTELEGLRNRVADLVVVIESKDALIASKDEFLNFLRGANNRPN